MTSVNTIKLYRFEKLESKRLDVIKLKKLWFSSPNRFNDLYDCHLHISKISDDYFSEKDLFSAVETLYKNLDATNKHPVDNKAMLLLFREHNFKKLKGDTVTKRLIDALAQGFSIFIPNCVEEIIRREIKTATGVCCFFGVAPESQLMWAHYADNHYGFCTEYNMNLSDTLSPVGPYSVCYTSDWPVKIDTKELIFSPESTINRVVTTKGIDWAHEKEYRFIKLGMLDHQKKEHGRKIDLPNGLNACRIIAGDRVMGDKLVQLKKLASDLDLEFTKMTRESFS